MTHIFRTNSDCSSIDDFLTAYWQQKPLLVRDAIDVSGYQLNPEELAGLAMEEEARSRLILCESDNSWQCQFGPLDGSDFAGLPQNAWTLLVQDIEKLLPHYAKLMEKFLFLPRWRLDDLMISYATDGGSVGPHVDQYDVFLLQLSGQRHWQIQSQGVDPDNLLPDIDLQILRNFNPEQEWLLNPGDMLYLPPSIAHHGVAIGECMTCSIGFRSPSAAELTLSLADSMNTANESKHHIRFRDQLKTSVQHRGELDGDTLRQVRAFILQSLDDTENLNHAIASWLSEPSQVRPEPISTKLSSRDWIQQQQHIHIHPAIQMLYMEGSGALQWYIDGESVTIEQGKNINQVKQLCDQYCLPAAKMLDLCDDDSLYDMLDNLYQQGALITNIGTE